MPTINLGSNVTLPTTASGPYYVGVNGSGQPTLGASLNLNVFGASIPASLHTFEFTFNTASAPSAETCSMLFFWSLDGGATYVALPGAGGAGFTGGTWVNPHTGVATGAKQIGPDTIQQSPYPDHFITQVTDCPTGMGPLNTVQLILA